MTAAMKIYEMSASLAGTDKTSGTVRFKYADNATVDSNDPIVIPGSGTVYSYDKKLRMFCATAPDTQVDNLRAYSDGTNSFGTGVGVNGSNVGVTFAAAATTLIANPASLFSKTSGSPWDIDATDAVAITATGFGGDMLKLQMTVEDTASPGTLSAETLTFAYDEI